MRGPPSAGRSSPPSNVRIAAVRRRVAEQQPWRAANTRSPILPLPDARSSVSGTAFRRTASRPCQCLIDKGPAIGRMRLHALVNAALTRWSGRGGDAFCLVPADDTAVATLRERWSQEFFRVGRARLHPALWGPGACRFGFERGSRWCFTLRLAVLGPESLRAALGGCAGLVIPILSVRCRCTRIRGDCTRRRPPD